MTAGKILPKVAPITSETIKGAIGVALLQVRNKHGLTNQALAERLGRHDCKSASCYIAGTTEIGAVALARGIADPEFGAQLGAAFAGLFGCALVPIDEAVGALPSLADVLASVTMMAPDIAATTDADLLANSAAIDDAGLAIDELRVSLSKARARAAQRVIRRVA